MKRRKIEPIVLTVKISDDDELDTRRVWIVGVCLVAVLIVYLGVLYDIQIVHHQDWLDQAQRSIVRYETVKASRGVITDRNGTALISNGFAYDLTFDTTLLKKGQEANTELLRVLRLLVSEGRGWNDRLPVSWEEPFVTTADRLSSEQKRQFLAYLSDLSETRSRLGNYLKEHVDLVDISDLEEAAARAEAEREEAGLSERIKELLKGGSSPGGPVLDGRKLLERLDPEILSDRILADAGIDGASLLDWMSRAFQVPDGLSPMERRTVLGPRYEMRLRVLGADNSVYVLSEDVDTALISLLSDSGCSGTRILEASVRQYETDAAAHILGTVGALYSEDLEDPAYEGYPLDATIGKSGVEAAFEQYLHGIDGRRVLSMSEEGKITGEYWSKEPRPGSAVELTIDLGFQEAVERALADAVEGMDAKDGLTSRGAGAAVVRVGTGEILALASYPTFKLSEYRARYDELKVDRARPLFDRSINGLYPPGSTLKPATAFAALDSGVTSLRERLYDTGRWHYPGSGLYTNCWYLPGHGTEYLPKAITDSCNYFFAEMGYRLGMDRLDHYLALFGLGDHTGIETGDSAGQRPFDPPGQDQAPWAAYGQSNQLYTPLQLANYIATLVSGGQRCQAHLLKAVRSYDNARILAQGNTDPVETFEIQRTYLEAIKTGMRDLARGQLGAYFDECVVDAGVKTGTAQLGGGLANNAVFVCFAPYDEPEIALGLVVEKGGSGSGLTATAVRILNAWFAETGGGAVTGDGQLLP